MSNSNFFFHVIKWCSFDIFTLSNMVSNDSSNILHLLQDFFIFQKYHTLLVFSDEGTE